MANILSKAKSLTNTPTMGSLGKVLKQFDMNPSTEDAFKERTTAGAFSIIISFILIFSLCYNSYSNGKSLLG